MKVSFLYYTGIKRKLFKNVNIHGSWDVNGNYSNSWSSRGMTEIVGEDGCPAYICSVDLNDNQAGWTFHWGVMVDTATNTNVWGIMTEIKDSNSQERIRSFELKNIDGNSTQVETYYLNESRRLGAQKYFKDGQGNPCIRFAVWAPNAQFVEVVMSYIFDELDPSKNPATDLNRHSDNQLTNRATNSISYKQICGGYIADSSAGIHPNWGPFPMTRQEDGIWVTDINDISLADFAKFDHASYMYRIAKDDGSLAFRSDIYSRCQIGYGNNRPDGLYTGRVANLDGTVSCSVVVDPDWVTTEIQEPVWPEKNWISQEDFWNDEPNFSPRPKKPEDLVIYELHVGALGFGKSNNEPGTLQDAIQFLDYLVELGVNTVELLPMSEYGGGVGGWGYSTSHYFAIEYSGGGRDQYKFFIRECHKRGIAVILDVVYNHYNHNAERAEWMYDSNWSDKNIYYWYEGKPWDYPDFDRNVENAGQANRKGNGGYIDNVSTAWAPRYHEEHIRKLFISSAIALVEEFYIDGFRLDQTTSIHDYNCLHADGRRVVAANEFGKKLLREFTNTLRLINPNVMIMAEDHSNRDEVTNSTNEGGMGFNAAWYADFYHHLIGDTDKGSDYAKLIKTTGKSYEGTLRMDWFAGALVSSAYQKVVYNESHDEAGNGALTDRTIRVASGMDNDNDNLIPAEARKYGESRCRFAAGITLLSAGTPMFLFGEEVGAEKKFLYGKVLENREDYLELKKITGKNLFNYYAQMISLRKSSTALRSRNIEIIYTHNENRVLVFRRWDDIEEYMIVCTLSNQSYNNPNYEIKSDKITANRWQEIFNSDSNAFGGGDVGNYGALLSSYAGLFNCVIPANGVIVFKRV